MECSWLLFNPDEKAGILYVEIRLKEFIESQPKSLGGADQFCEQMYPIIDQVQQLCISRNMKQVCTANFEDIRLTSIRPHVLLKIIWNVYNHTKDCILLEGCEISHSNSVITTLVQSVRSLLPPFMRNMVSINNTDAVVDDTEDNSPDLVSGLEEFTSKIPE
jgi:hypothetical protein